jgi:hypothetical protein
MAIYLRVCPNNTKATISIILVENDKIHKKSMNQNFKCDGCDKVFGRIGLFCYHRHRNHARE